MKPGALLLAIFIVFLSIKPTAEVFAGQEALRHACSEQVCNEEAACTDEQTTCTEKELTCSDETDSCAPQKSGTENTCTDNNCSDLCSPLNSCCLILNYCFKGELLALPIPKSINNTSYINLKIALVSNLGPEFWQPPKI